MIKKALFSILIFSFGAYLFAQKPLIPSDTTKVVVKKDSIIKTQPIPAVAPVNKPAAPVTKPVAPATQPVAEPAKTTTARSSVSMSSTLKKGFYLRAGFMLPSTNYMGGDAKTGYDFQMGSQFYLTPVIANHLKIGLDFSWLDLSYAAFKSDIANGYTGIITVIGVGPVVSYAPIEELAISTYAKAMPSFNVRVGDEMVPNDLNIPVSQSVGRGGFNINGLWGLEIRYSLLDLGYEFNWGSSSMTEIGSKTGVDNTTKPTFKINNSRFYIGVRF